MFIHLTLLVVFSTCLWDTAASSGTISVYMHSYNNPSSRDYLGFCCDAGPWCISHCDNYFTVCAQPQRNGKCGNVQATGIFRDDSLEFPKDLKNGLTNPLMFVFKGAYNGTVSLNVEVWDEDVADVDDLIAMFPGNFSVPAANPNASRNGTLMVITRNERQLVVTIKVSCSEHFYGEKCQTYCRPSKNESEFVQCNPWTGEKECLPGKRGVDCRESKCRPGCSLEHGTCENEDDCICQSGWEGFNCTECITKDQCWNGYCKEGNDCICHPGWEGELCDEKTSPAKSGCKSSPCQNGGKCHDLKQKMYKCTCLVGFTGEHCEIELDPCYNYKNFSGEGRAPIDYADPKGRFRSDRHLKEDWYRIIGTRSGVLFNRCGALYTCGTKYPIHIQETILRNITTIVPAHACASSCLDCCHVKMDILVKSCPLNNGQFFVYKLRPPLSNEMGYCVE